MKRTLRREVSWFGANLAVLIAYLFAFTLGQAVVLLVTSPDGSVAPGWSGDPATQVLGWATMSGWYTAFFSPLVIVALVPYRLIAQMVGRPRRLAFAMALAITGLAAVLVPRADSASVVVLGIALVGYAALVRLPGQTLEELPAGVRGLVVGLALSSVWLVGSVIAVGWATYRATHGDWVEAGAVVVAGTAVPAVLMFMDLFRDDAPDTNYVIAALLLGSLAGGLVLLIRKPVGSTFGVVRR